MWRDNQPHGYSRPTLFPHSAKRVRDCRQNHHDCRQNIPWLLWNAHLTTLYVSEHYKYMFLVARDLYEMLVLYTGKHTTRHSTVGIWSEVRVYCTPATNILLTGSLRLGKLPDNRRSMWNSNKFIHIVTMHHNTCSYPSPGAFNRGVGLLHSCLLPQCSHLPYRPRHQRCLVNCDTLDGSPMQCGVGRQPHKTPFFHPRHRHPPSWVNLPRRAWVQLYRFHTSVGYFRSCFTNWIWPPVWSVNVAHKNKPSTMLSSNVQSIDLLVDYTAWCFWTMRQLKICTTPAPRSSAVSSC